MKSIEHKEGKIKWKVFKEFSFKVMRLTLDKIADNPCTIILALFGIYILFMYYRQYQQTSDSLRVKGIQ